MFTLYAAKAIVTGGAGFIGSHIVDKLMTENCDVTVIDNLSSGNEENLKKWFNHPNFKLVRLDLKDFHDLNKAIEDADMTFHLAANPEVRVGIEDPNVHFKENLVSTFNLLEAMRINKAGKRIIFASTSTVYGEPEKIPTPEEYSPMLPISTYGATKLGCEAIISAYTHTFDLKALILRMANVVGSRSRHGVIYDFVQKLKKSPKRLHILGDGSQKKSYMYIKDCVNAILHLTEKFMKNDNKIEIYNVGSNDQVTVKRIAERVIETMGLKDVDLVYTGGIEGGRGWKGDVKYMQLSVDKLIKSGWKPRHGSAEAIRLATEDLLTEIV